MTEIEIAKWIVMTALGGVVWFMKRTLDQTEKRIDSLERDQQLIKEQYLHKNDFKDFKLELRGMFEDLRQDIRSLRPPNV